MAGILMIAGDQTACGQLQYALYRMIEERIPTAVAAPVKRRLDTVIDMREENWSYDTEKLGYWAQPDAALDEIDPFTFDGLLLPGGRAAEYLRDIDRCVKIVRHFVENDKPIGAMCQGSRILAAAGVKGRRLTGLDMIKLDITKAGNTYVAAGGEAVVDGNIVTVSRRPYYYVWVRGFLSLLRHRGIVKPSEFHVSRARILIVAGDGSSSGHTNFALHRMREAGCDVTIAAPRKGQLITVVHQMDEAQNGGAFAYVERPGYILEANAAFDEIDPSTFDGLLIPGGRAPEYLRNMEACVKIVRHFLESDKPIGAICHGPHLLIAAGVKGRRMTAIDFIKSDIPRSGNIFVEADKEAVVDGNIVTAWRYPYYGAWTREFLALLQERGIKRS
jgi:PfpI family intracellular protease